MFLDTSRYARIAIVEVRLATGRLARAVKLRRLPATTGAPVTVADTDRLDVMSQRRYDDPTRFWHIADANSELEAAALVARPSRTISVPEN